MLLKQLEIDQLIQKMANSQDIHELPSLYSRFTTLLRNYQQNR